MGANALEFQNASYYCDTCKTNRRLRFDTKNHNSLMQFSSNGLVPYSDIHSCVDNILEANNIAVDKNYHIRTRVLQTLKDNSPKVGRMIPMPGTTMSDSIHKAKVLDLEKDISAIIENKNLNYILTIGRRVEDRELVKTITSSSKNILLHLYQSEEVDVKILGSWLQCIIDAMDIHQTHRVGQVIEAFKYVFQKTNKGASKMDCQIIDTIIAMHRLQIQIINEINYKENLKKCKPKPSGEDILFFMDVLTNNGNNKSEPIIHFFGGTRLVKRIKMLFSLQKNEMVKIIEKP